MFDMVVRHTAPSGDNMSQVSILRRTVYDCSVGKTCTVSTNVCHAMLGHCFDQFAHLALLFYIQLII